MNALILTYLRLEATASTSQSVLNRQVTQQEPFRLP
jgi:hypothetical protein